MSPCYCIFAPPLTATVARVCELRDTWHIRYEMDIFLAVEKDWKVKN